jgi:hypothetical protein
MDNTEDAIAGWLDPLVRRRKENMKTPRTDAVMRHKDVYQRNGNESTIAWSHATNIEAELVELAGIINSARDRSLDEEACRPCRWLIELPMTDAEANRFRDILSANRVAEPSNA